MQFFYSKSLLLIVLSILAAPCAALAAEVIGPATVIDGDTLQVGKQKVRLNGIDAPEWNQMCQLNGKPWRAGREATAWLKSWIEGRRITCTDEARDRYKRQIATCFMDRQNINAALVQNGWAFAYRRYSTRYVNQETQAKAAQRGLWQGQCDQPEAWRHSKRKSKQ